jgi:Rrf2 family iron-sulfur cluster assembly transcriptional regulator
VIAAVDEAVDTTRCSGAVNCHDGQQCLTHELWDDLSQQIYEFLDDISLQDLMAEGAIQKVAERQDRRMQEDDSLQVSLTNSRPLTDPVE